MMDEEIDFDPDEVMSKIDEAEVISLFFPTFRKSVVIDTRYNDTEGPMIRVLPMVASPQERLRSIRRLRPSFPRLQHLTLIPWPRYVDSLVSLGVWDRIVGRLARSGHNQLVELCDSILAELVRLEKRGLAGVVRGDNFRTVRSADR